MAMLPATVFSMDIRINAGGGDYTDSAGNLWSADSGYNTGTAYSIQDPIAFTTDDPLYQSERWDDASGPELEYSFDVPNGDYMVNLHFSDRYNTGRRIFDVEIEGQLVLDNLDISSEAGMNAALVKSLPVRVYDGQLNIRFLHGVQNPKINAIEILNQTSAAVPLPPSGLCISTGADDICAPPQQQALAFDTSQAPSTKQATTGQTGLFPGTDLKFRPGFVIASSENESVSSIESRWQALFTSSPNRKASYRPPGIYGSVTRRLHWKRFYTNESVRPSDPRDHTDPAYDWSLLDAIFQINAVKNEGALVLIEVMDVSWGSTPVVPRWLVNAPYNGIVRDTDKNRVLTAYHRYSGPDIRGMINVGDSPPIVDEFTYFHQAMYDHLVATGNINKVMGVLLSEFYGASASGNLEDYIHGIGIRVKSLHEIWGRSRIPVYQLSISGGKTKTQIFSQYISTLSVGVGYPDMKLENTGNPPVDRFTVTGVYQKDIRPLIQLTEGNGQRFSTYFSPEIPNPWGYSGASTKQTASHILWALSGSPKGANKDSGLGQMGEDPPGILPVHTIVIDFGRSWQKNSPSVEEWHKAIDTFGPPGTFAFPYLPPGYNP